MAGQLWSVPQEGGYLYSGELSDVLRETVQPLTKFRQLCDMEDGTDKGANAGEKFQWNVFKDVGTQGRDLSENTPMPETNFQIKQRELTVTEAGNSVPYTGKLEMLGKQDVVKIIDKTLKNDARKYFDIKSFEQFNACKLRVAPTAGTATDSVTLTENGTTATTNNVAMGADHVKAIVDVMKERNIPAFRGDDYGCVSHTTTYRPFKNDLETIHQYTDTGLNMIFAGEIGRYENCRFIEQNHIAKGGAADSTTFDPWTGTNDAWDNAKSGWAFYFGADTVTEAIVLPEEIRAKLPGDFGRSKGIAWYYLGGFGIAHDDAEDGRIVKWDSAA